MNLFRVTATGITARFDHVSARLVSQLATQVASLLAEREDQTEDSAIRRLLPDGYRDDAANAEEFRRFTEEDLADEKIRGALVVAEQLDPALASEDSSEDVVVTLNAEQAVVWAKAITDIRLVLGVRLGIGDDAEPAVENSDELSATYEVFMWLADLQWSLVEAIDR